MPIPAHYFKKLPNPLGYSLYFYYNYLINVFLIAYLNKQLTIIPEGMEDEMQMMFWLNLLFQSIFIFFPCAIMSLAAFGLKLKKRPLDLLVNLFLALAIWCIIYFIMCNIKAMTPASVFEVIKFNILIAGIASVIGFPFAKQDE